MTVDELIKSLKKTPYDAEVFFDDLNGGRIPISVVRIEQAAKFLKPGSYTKPSIVVITDTGALE